MKRSIVCWLACMTCLFLLCSCSGETNPLVGTWKMQVPSTGNKEFDKMAEQLAATITFTKDTMSGQMAGQQLGNKKVVYEEVRHNDTKEVVGWTVHENEDGKKGKPLGLLRLNDKDTLKLTLGGDLLTLKRVK